MNGDRALAYQKDILRVLARASSRIRRIFSTPSADELKSIITRLQAEEPFLYSVLQDTLGSAVAHIDKPKFLALYADVIRVRFDSLGHWQQDGNDTITAIEAGQIDADAVKPHIRLEPAAYDRFYSDQSERMAERAVRAGGKPGGEAEKSYIEFGLNPNVNHSFRWTHAVSLVENLLGIVASLGEADMTVRWMDIGCGTGHFANAVNPARFDLKKWEIVGCDVQAGKIAIAEKQKAFGRHFFASDCFAMLENYRTRDETFDLVSMFEFLEHLSDPLKFIRQLHLFRPKYVLAASPLAQKLNLPRDVKPDRAHLWSFSRRGWEQMFELAGFSVVYSSEVRVGSYIGGLDWLTIACGPREELREGRRSLN